MLLLIGQNLHHPYLSYCIPCHCLPLRSLHWLSCYQKGILNIHPIICLRRIPGPARLVGLSLFFLLILALFCHSTVFALPILRDFLSIGGAIGKVTPLAGPGLSRPWKWYLKCELSGLGVSEFWGKVSLWVVFFGVFKILWRLYLSSKMLERPKATIFSHNSTTRDN